MTKDAIYLAIGWACFITMAIFVAAMDTGMGV